MTTTTIRPKVYKVRGDDWDIPVVISVTDEDGVTTPFDLTGCAIRSTIGSWTGSLAGGNILAPSPATGELTIIVPRATTALMSTGELLADVEVTTTDNKVKTPLVFIVVVTPDASR